MLSRREALGRIALLGAGAWAAGCTPLRIALRAYPEAFETDADLLDRTLRAFATAVIPGVAEDRPDLVRAFYDEELSSLARYRGFLAADVCRRASRGYGVRRFADLPADDRRRVIRDGLEADGTTRRLYRGAILLTQISVYASIYDDERGCPLIEWEGRYRPRPLSELSYPNPDVYLSSSMTPDGNYA